MGWTEYWHQHVDTVATQKALYQKFTIYGKELKQVEAFKYLGLIVTFDDNDVRAVNVNLQKVCK